MTAFIRVWLLAMAATTTLAVDLDGRPVTELALPESRAVVLFFAASDFALSLIRNGGAGITTVRDLKTSASVSTGPGHSSIREAAMANRRLAVDWSFRIPKPWPTPP
jgi:hypothetical protein